MKYYKCALYIFLILSGLITAGGLTGMFLSIFDIADYKSWYYFAENGCNLIVMFMVLILWLERAE